MTDALISSELIAAIGWSLLHSLWQGALLAIILGILLVLSRTFSSQTRYLIIALFLALFAATLPLTIIRQYQKPLVYNLETAPDIVFSPATKASMATVRKQPLPQINVVTDIHNRFITYFNRHLPLLVTLWLMGLIGLLLRFLGQLAFVQRLKHHGVVPFPAKWQVTISKLEHQLNIPKKVRYLESLRTATPLTIGWLKPVVLFPIGLATRLSPDEVEVILLHELAHIKRNDFLFNALQSLVTILLFFHPVTHWMSRLLDAERENCCDDLVVGITGQQENYARTLIHLQEQKFTPMKTALSFTGTPTSFSGRIMRIVNKSFLPVNRFREGLVTAWVLVAGLSFLAATGLKNHPATAPHPVKKSINLKQEDKRTLALSAPIGPDKADKDLPAASLPSEKAEKEGVHPADEVDKLIKAIDDQDEKMFSYLLKQGVNVNGISSNGKIPLDFAAAEGRLKYVKLLLENGAKINQAGDEQNRPLMAAAREGHEDVVRFLLPLSPKLSAQQKTDLLITAIDNGQESLVEYLLSQGADINGISLSKAGWTPLGYAAAEGRTKLVNLLVKRGAKINYPLHGHRMPLLAAAGEGKLDIVQILLAAGAEIETGGEHGTTALSIAAREGHQQVVDYLLTNGAQADKPNQEGWTPFHFATVQDQIAIIKRLMAAGANIERSITTERNNWDDTRGEKVYLKAWTPLMLAVEEGHLEATKVLLDARANVNVKVEKTAYALAGDGHKEKSIGKLLYVATGWTPLMEAVEKQNPALVQLLLANGADKNARTKEGMSASSIAAKLRNQEIISLLK